MCNMTYLGHHATLTWPSRSSGMCFDSPWREEDDCVRIISLALFKCYLRGNKVFAKTASFTLLDIQSLNCLSGTISDDTLPKEQFKSYQCFFFRDLLPIPNILRDNGIFLEKYYTSLNLTFDDFCWPQYWFLRKVYRRNFLIISGEHSDAISVSR